MVVAVELDDLGDVQIDRHGLVDRRQTSAERVGLIVPTDFYFNRVRRNEAGSGRNAVRVLRRVGGAVLVDHVAVGRADEGCEGSEDRNLVHLSCPQSLFESKMDDRVSITDDRMIADEHQRI